MLALLKLLRQHSRIRCRHKEKRKTRRREVTVTLHWSWSVYIKYKKSILDIHNCSSKISVCLKGVEHVSTKDIGF
jgi:hypothetical protein